MCFRVSAQEMPQVVETKMNGEAFRQYTHLASLRSHLEQREKIVASLRRFFSESGFLEVETPLRIAAPAPETHIEAEPSGSRFLITSPELQMKRLLAAGYEKIFEICHCFRQGERSERHLPEFTMLEWYRLGGREQDLMEDCETLLTVAAQAIGVYPMLHCGDCDIDLTPSWPRISVADAFERYAGWRPEAEPDEDRFNCDLVTKVEPSLPKTHPVFLTGYPAAMASLARLNAEDPRYAERFELYVGDLELANGFSELVDPIEQRRRFVIESHKRAKAGKAHYPLDEKFLAALELGLPASAGIALGVDRLVMLLTGASSIDEVVAFTGETL